MVDVDVVQPAQIAAGLGAAAAALALWWRWRPIPAADLSALLAVAALWWQEQVPATVVTASAVLVVSRLAPGRFRLAGAVPAVVVLAFSRGGDPLAGSAMVMAAGGLLVIAGVVDRPHSRWLAGWAATTALAATFVGGPDTEVTVAVAAAVLPAVLLAAAPFPPTAALVVVAWAAVDAYRGRPAGLVAAAVACTTLLVPLLVERDRVRPCRRLPASVALPLASLVTIAAARTVGLHSTLDPSSFALGALACAAVVVLGLLSAEPAAGRRPPG